MTLLLEGKVAVITGANQGLGLEISRTYVDSGASIMICARDEVLLKRSRDVLAVRAKPGQFVLAQRADISSPEDTAQVVEETHRVLGHVDILVNNAGIYGPKGPIEENPWDEWVRAIEINLLGSVLMCRAVLPHLKRAGRGKIIQLSGGGATSPLPMISAYATSKAAVIRFTETLAEEVRSHGIDVNAIAPGALNTRMLDEILASGPQSVGAEFYGRALKQRDGGGAPLQRAAELALFLGSNRSDGISGKLISAVWDPWTELPEHLDDLQASDVYTLRRIVPKDRGMPWADKP